MLPYRKPTQVGEMSILRCRDNYAQGTRQNSRCNFGINLADAFDLSYCVGCSERLQATVYQKHRSMLNRKVMYIG